MASGTLGRAALAPNTWTAIYSPGTVAVAPCTVSIEFCNYGTSQAHIGLAISTASSTAGITPQDYVTFGRPLDSSDEYGVSGRVLTVGTLADHIYAWCDIGSVAVQVHGSDRNP